MRKIPQLLPLLLAGACAAPAPRYADADPLSGSAPATPVIREGKTLFSAVIPEGYDPAAGRLSPPLAEDFRRAVYDGEASISVEIYLEENGAPSLESFTRKLHPENPVAKTRPVAGIKLETYHDLRFESFARRIPVGDPSGDSLGTHLRPPKLDWLDRRRFPKGGEAYRLYRCRRAHAWRILRQHTRRRMGLKPGDDAPPEIESAERKLLSACFGRQVLEKLIAGEDYGTVPRPTMSRLRLMAKDEWEHGAARRIERECVHLRPVPGGFAALRFRAPDHAFDDQHPAWELFLSTLKF